MDVFQQRFDSIHKEKIKTDRKKVETRIKDDEMMKVNFYHPPPGMDMVNSDHFDEPVANG